MVQPSAAQVYQEITSIPWIVKPLWGLLTDVLPMAGYRRRPYLILSENSIEHPCLAADMQSLCKLSESNGGILGFPISGLLVHAIGSQGELGLLSITSALALWVGIMLKEAHIPNFAYGQCPYVWKPCVYMYIYIALCLNIQEGMFYWYTDQKSGPSFSQETIGFLFSIGFVGSLLCVLLYQKLLKNPSLPWVTAPESDPF